MRFVTMFVMSFLLLSACASTENQSEDSNTNGADAPSENVQEESEELTEEEQMLNDLPNNAHTDDWNLILVNPWESLPDGYNPELVEAHNQQYIDVRIEEAWNQWYEAALVADHRLFFASGYRSVERQENNFNNQLNDYLNEGLSEAEATERTKEFLTEPGHSEHHTGLALDIVDEEWIAAGNGLEQAYETQASQQWLVDTMTEYGFILRYPEGKEEVTGIQYEPWHFRYVGQDNAEFIEEHQLALEEYIELLNMREESTQTNS